MVKTFVDDLSEKDKRRRRAQSLVGTSAGRPDDDFYRTPPEATHALLDRERFDGIIWEPACGDGANGLDFPSLNVDIKVTSVKQPQSSCQFRSIRQKIYGLGYGLLVFVYDKADDAATQTATLGITDTVFIESEVTADFQMTKGLIEVLDAEGNEDDLASFMMSRHLTTDEIELQKLAEEVMKRRPIQGYLTISPALQWRLQYGRVIQKAGEVAGVRSIYKAGQ